MSTSVKARLLAQANTYAETADDMNVVDNSGSFEILPEGTTVARLVEYVETGDHMRQFEGKDKGVARFFNLGFALFDEGFTTADGKPRVLRVTDLYISRNEKAKAYKLFQRMNWTGDPATTTFAQMLDHTFLVEVKHKKSKTSGKEYAYIDLNEIRAALDPRSKKPYDVPEAPDELFSLFLYDSPTKADWDRLYIDGKRDDGKSKNYLQEKIQSSRTFEGSVLQQLLGGVAALPPMSSEDEDAQPDGDGAEGTATAPAEPAAKPKVQPRRTPPKVADVPAAPAE